MKLALLILVIVFAAPLRCQKINQEVRYLRNGAEEVCMVWGVDNWQLIPQSDLPPGSWISDNLIYTPMSPDAAGGFVASISVGVGRTIDYVFRITRGPFGKPLEIWDTNAPFKDYHTVATQHAKVNIMAPKNVVPGEQLSILDFAYPLILISVIFFVFILLIFVFFCRKPFASKPSQLVIAGASVLVPALLLIRITVAGKGWDLFYEPLHSAPGVLWSGYHDVVYALCLSTFFLILLWLTRKFPFVQKLFCGLFVVLLLLSLLAAIANIRVVETLGRPFNYQWLYYSDFLSGPDSRAAIMANLPEAFTQKAICVCAAFIFFAGTAILFQQFPVSQPFKRAWRLTVLGLTTIYLIIAPYRIRAQRLSYNLTANPVFAFVESLNPFARPALFSMDVPDSLRYKVGPRTASTTCLSGDIPRNVVIIVLESTPAEYIDVYGSKNRLTPNIEKLAKNGLIFENVYAHAPATNFSMVSLLCSIYPWLSYSSLTEEHPQLEIPSISGVLKSKGYRTSFFNSGDNHYQKAGEFLSARQFDFVSDCSDGDCQQNKFEVKNTDWKFMSGRDDGCSARQMLNWIDNDTARPFFTVLWTYQTHYPYFFEGREKDYEPQDKYLNRYLNALCYSDSIIGGIADHLIKKDLFKSTLLVIVGDHGEAFGRHQQITHAQKIYEENLHIPCIFVNPGFAGKRIPCTGGMVDVAPTVMNLLNHDLPVEWEGESLLAKTKSSKAFFFAPWSDYLFGYREGNRKFIYNATKNETEVYALDSDPQEKKTITLPEHEMKQAFECLAGWAQFVNASSEKRLRKN